MGGWLFHDSDLYTTECTYVVCDGSNVIFLRGGTALASKPDLYEMTMPDDDQHTLKLLRVKSTDIGEMMFVASNKYGSDCCTFTVELAGPHHHRLTVYGLESQPTNITVSAAPPIFESIMEDLDVCVGETPRFAVVVEGRPIPDILWFKVHFFTAL